MINRSGPKIRLFSLSSALTVPIWSGESRDWSISKCRSDVVSGRAQEPGLLRLRQAPHPHHRQAYPPCLVSLSVPENWFQYVSVLWVYLCSFVCVSGMLVVILQQLQLLGTSTLTWWSCSVYWTRRSIWKHSQENCNYRSTPHSTLTLTDRTCLSSWLHLSLTTLCT